MKTLIQTTAALLSFATLVTACVASEEATDEDETIDDVDGKGDGYSVPELGVRFDRIGRPELTNITLASPSLNKQLYNGEDTFALSSNRATYLAIATGTLNRYDTFDGVENMTDAQVAKLAEVLIDDQLRIDLSKPCSVDANNYLAIERGEFLGQPWTSCGGRTPNDDVIDHVLTLVTGGLGATTQVHDGIATWDDRTAAQKKAFPYLAEAF